MNLQFSNLAQKQFANLDKSIQKRIFSYLQNVAQLENPRLRGEPMRWDWAGAWRYRVGSYRIICEITDDENLIWIIEIAHRRKVYN